MNIKDIIVIASCRPTSVRYLKFFAIRVPNNESLKKNRLNVLVYSFQIVLHKNTFTLLKLKVLRYTWSGTHHL